MATRSTTITIEGRSWQVELLLGASKHECPRVDIVPLDDPEARETYAYKLGTEWFSPGYFSPCYTEPTLRSALDHAVKQLDGASN